MMRYDVAVLGGGIIGCALAEELARHGVRVALIERGRIGAEASAAAAGILSSQVDLASPGPLFELCQAARRMYPRWVEQVQRRSGMSVGYHVDGIVSLVLSAREERAMDRQARWQRRVGLRVERWSAKTVRRHEPAIDGRVRCGFLFPTEPQVDNAILMRALALACRKAGVTVREGVSARRLLLRARAVSGVELDHGGSIEAKTVVNCLGSWAAMGGAFPVPLPVEPARGQILVFQGPRRLFRHAVMSGRGYVVQRRDGRLLVGSTVERVGFDKSLTFDGMHTILSGLRSLTSAMNACALVESWAGLRPRTPDQLPILGATAIEGLHVATGHFRHGILLAPITAHLMAQLILRGRSAHDLSPFSASRFQK